MQCDIYKYINIRVEGVEVATNVEQRIEKRVDFTTVLSRTSSKKTKA